MEQTRQDIEGIKSKLQNLSPSLDFTQPVIAEPFQVSIKVCVAKTVHDINRRDSNVVVVGLPETT